MRWLLLILFLPLPAWGQERPAKTGAYQIIESVLLKRLPMLAQQYRLDPWNPARPAAAQAEVRRAAEDLRAYLATADNRKDLQTLTDGSTPLRLAVLFGTAEIVELLLEYPEVRAQVNDVFSDSETLWTTASTVSLQGWMVCGGDGHVIAGIIAPMMSYLGFEAAHSPYRNIRQMLEAAGAVPQLDQAREAWLHSCDPSRTDGDSSTRENIPGVRQRIADAPDIQEAILTELEAYARSKGWIRS
jgi:hypothetical protein